MMWNEILNQKDIDSFMFEMCNFHDSCIKEIRYLSGAYVSNDLAMYPFNDKRILSVIIQRQFKDISMIELQFIGLKCLKLFPVNEEEYTCEITDSTMVLKDNYIYWYDCEKLSNEDLLEYEGTYICASKLRWRIINNSMGNVDYYKTL